MLHHFSTRGSVAWHVPHGRCLRLHGVCWRLHGVCWRLHGRHCGVCFAAHAMAHASGLWAWRVLALAWQVPALAWQVPWQVLCSKRHGTRHWLVAMACAGACMACAGACMACAGACMAGALHMAGAMAGACGAAMRCVSFSNLSES